jgi:hypothetical protein
MTASGYIQLSNYYEYPPEIILLSVHDFREECNKGEPFPDFRHTRYLKNM